MSDARCEAHGCELSACGDMTEDGPLNDCRECQLETSLAAAEKKVNDWEWMALSGYHHIGEESDGRVYVRRDCYPEPDKIWHGADYYTPIRAARDAEGSGNA